MQATNMSLQTIDRPRWVRSTDGLVAGVCSGLGKSFGVDPWVVRGLWLVSVLAFGTGVLLYLILAFCLPREDQLLDAQRKRLLGVCSRIAKASGIEVGAVRTLAVLLALASLGTTVVVYVILNFVLPEDRDANTLVY